MEQNKINIKFSYTDEFSQTTNVDKSVNYCVVEDEGSFEYLVDEFKSFLLVAGFSREAVDSIEIISNE